MPINCDSGSRRKGLNWHSLNIRDTCVRGLKGFLRDSDMIFWTFHSILVENHRDKFTLVS